MARQAFQLLGGGARPRVAFLVEPGLAECRVPTRINFGARDAVAVLDLCDRDVRLQAPRGTRTLTINGTIGSLVRSTTTTLTIQYCTRWRDRFRARAGVPPAKFKPVFSNPGCIVRDEQVIIFDFTGMASRCHCSTPGPRRGVTDNGSQLEGGT